MTTTTYPYSEDYWPPMPVVEVGLSKPGRNVLQHLVVTLNGPASVTEIVG